MSQLDELFGPGAQPIQREAIFQQKSGANGEPTAEAVEATSVTLSAEGSIDRARLIGFLHCGHAATDGIGGKCTEPGCQNTSCIACYANARCIVCFKGLCLAHKYEVVTDGVVRVVCLRCRERIQRQRRTRAIARWLLSPFVNFKDDKA
jgi:hypothetical protein